MTYAVDIHPVARFFLSKAAAIFLPDSPLRVIGKCRDHSHGMPLGREVLTQAGRKGRYGSALRKVVDAKD